MGRGGAERRTIDLMKSLDPTRVSLEFCTLGEAKGALDSEIRELGGRVHPTPLGPGFPLRFLRLLHDRDYGAVHAHVHHTSGPLVALAALAKVPVRVVHYRSCSDGQSASPRRRLQRHIFRALVERHATNILAVSESAMRSAWKQEWRTDPRCRVIYNGIDLTDYPPLSQIRERPSLRDALKLPKRTKLIVHVGRYTAAKNHLRMLSMFASHRSRNRSGHDTHLVLVGRDADGLEPVLDALIHQRGLQDFVHRLGERDDVASLLQQSDMMLFPSLWEGLPGAVLEACAAHLPVLASAIDPIVELQVRLPSVRSLALDRPDSTWADAITKMLNHPPPAPEIAASRHALDDGPFSMARCRAQHLDVWGAAANL